MAILALGISLVSSNFAHAAGLSQASLILSDPRPSQVANYSFTGSGVTLSAIRCIKEVYADTAAGTNVPLGMTTTAATLDTTNTNFIPTPTAWTIARPANGTLQITNTTGETPASAAARKLVFNGINSPSTADTRYYLRLSTFSNTDCASGPIDSVTVLFVVTNGSTLSLSVDPTLSFSVNAVAAGQTCNGATSTQSSTATTIPFGSVSSAADSIVCQDLSAATNATSGFTVYVRSTSQPTNSLGQAIAPVSGTNTAPAAFPAAGTEAYGYTTSDPSLGTGTPGRFQTNLWAAVTTANAEVAYEANGVTASTYRIGHEVGVSNTTHPGTYQTTIIYTCTPVY